VGADDLAGVERSVDLGIGRPGDALPDTPLRARVVLRLDGKERPDCILG
jgi:hypothetical protein